MSLCEAIEERASFGMTGRTAECTVKEIVDHFNLSAVMTGEGEQGAIIELCNGISSIKEFDFRIVKSFLSFKPYSDVPHATVN